MLAGAVVEAACRAWHVTPGDLSVEDLEREESVKIGVLEGRPLTFEAYVIRKVGGKAEQRPHR